MRVFARIENGIVQELHTAESDVSEKFHAALRWVEVTGQAVAEGFRETVGGFERQLEPKHQLPVPPTLAGLQAELAGLAARIATLQDAH